MWLLVACSMAAVGHLLLTQRWKLPVVLFMETEGLTLFLLLLEKQDTIDSAWPASCLASRANNQIYFDCLKLFTKHFTERSHWMKSWEKKQIHVFLKSTSAFKKKVPVHLMSLGYHSIGGSPGNAFGYPRFASWCLALCEAWVRQN